MEENTFPKKVELGISVLLLISGIALYVAWGIWYNAWNFFDPLYIGLYSLVIVHGPLRHLRYPAHSG